jgi:tRNA G18 (ribose-2'-O)-methylase SpoU
MGADFMFTIGKRYKKQASDTEKSWKHTPLWHFEDFDDFKSHLPFEARLIGVELDDRARDLATYLHPERAVYMLGAEDTGIPQEILYKCHDLVQMQGERCLNVAVAGSILMYHRMNGFRPPS